MGADLILNFVWAKKTIALDWDGAREHIDNLTSEQLQLHPQYEYFEMEYEEGWASTNLKRHLLNCHDKIHAAWYGDFDRESAIIEIGIYEVLITGGMSWGDSPSDMFDYIHDWADVEGLDKFGFYNE